MHTTTPLGSCPHCGNAVPRDRLLIEYERGDKYAVFAECPDCTEVVRPESS